MSVMTFCVVVILEYMTCDLMRTTFHLCCAVRLSAGGEEGERRHVEVREVGGG